MHPFGKLNDVVDHQVILGASDRRQAAVKCVEEAWAYDRPGEIAALGAPVGQHTAFHKLIRCDMPERLVDQLLDRACERGFAGARWPIQKDDLAVGHNCFPSPAAAWYFIFIVLGL